MGLLSAEELFVVVDVAVAVVVHLDAAASGAGESARTAANGAAVAVVVGCKKTRERIYGNGSILGVPEDFPMEISFDVAEIYQQHCTA